MKYLTGVRSYTSVVGLRSIELLPDPSVCVPIYSDYYKSGLETIALHSAFSKYIKSKEAKVIAYNLRLVVNILGTSVSRRLASNGLYYVTVTTTVAQFGSISRFAVEYKETVILHAISAWIKRYG